MWVFKAEKTPDLNEVPGQNPNDTKAHPPHHSLFILLPSGKWYRSICSLTIKLWSSFFLLGCDTTPHSYKLFLFLYCHYLFINCSILFLKVVRGIKTCILLYNLVLYNDHYTWKVETLKILISWEFLYINEYCRWKFRIQRVNTVIL